MAVWLYTSCACWFLGLLGLSWIGTSMIPGMPEPSSSDVTATGPTAYITFAHIMSFLNQAVIHQSLMHVLYSAICECKQALDCSHWSPRGQYTSYSSVPFYSTLYASEADEAYEWNGLGGTVGELPDDESCPEQHSTVQVQMHRKARTRRAGLPGLHKTCPGGPQALPRRHQLGCQAVTGRHTSGTDIAASSRHKANRYLLRHGSEQGMPLVSLPRQPSCFLNASRTRGAWHRTNRYCLNLYVRAHATMGSTIWNQSRKPYVFLAFEKLHSTKPYVMHQIGKDHIIHLT